MKLQLMAMIPFKQTLPDKYRPSHIWTGQIDLYMNQLSKNGCSQEGAPTVLRFWEECGSYRGDIGR